MGEILDLLGTPNAVMTEIKKYVGIACTVFMVICGLLLVLYAVYIGFRMAKAEDDGKRKEAKNHLIYAIIGFIAIAIIVVMFRAVLPSISNTYSSGIGAVDTTLALVVDVIALVMELVGTAAICFAVYIGWQFIKAEDEGKRKNAKMQLIYTFIAIIAVTILATLAQAVPAMT